MKNYDFLTYKVKNEKLLLALYFLLLFWLGHGTARQRVLSRAAPWQAKS